MRTLNNPTNQPTTKIDPERTRDVIGKDGELIRALIEGTGATYIDSSTNGTIQINSVDAACTLRVANLIEEITAVLELDGRPWTSGRKNLYEDERERRDWYDHDNPESIWGKNRTSEEST